MHKIALTIGLLLSCFLSSIVAQNVLISDQYKPCEPSICFDPNNPDIIIAGSVLNHYHISKDGGKTWRSDQLTSSYGVWGDPVIDVDTVGDFYFFHLSNPSSGNWIDRIVCQKSTDRGTTWSDGTFMGLNGKKAQDKHWSIIDRNNNNIYITWTQFDKYGSMEPSDSSIILFSKSLDAGSTWSTPIRINKHAGDCVDSDYTVEGAVPAIGPNGEIYVSWAGPKGILFNRSLNQGETWLKEEILIDSLPGGWEFDIPGLSRANGLPITKCDLSEGPNHGTIYVNWSDQRNGIDNTDIWLSKSSDSGNSWTKPTKINDDNSQKHQFFTWMDIDQTNGHLYFVFYDRRAYSDHQTDVYLATSTDGGISFLNKKISTSPFIPNSGIFFGDYNNIVAHNNIIRPIWTRLHNGQLSIWTDISPIDSIFNSIVQLSINDSMELVQYPNPASDIIFVSFKLHNMSVIDLELIDEKGRTVYSLLKQDKKGYGKYIIPIEINKMGLIAGIYYCRITINEVSKVLKTIVVE